MSHPPWPDERRRTTAKRLLTNGTLTETEYVRWAMAEVGMTHRDIAWYVKRGKGTVTDSIQSAEAKLRRAMQQEDAWADSDVST